MDVPAIPPPHGSLRIGHVDPVTGRYCWLHEIFNQTQYDWGFIVAQLLRGRSQYQIGAMYAEFANLADPDDAVPIPSFERSAGVEYYDNLGGDADYLRLPLVGEPILSIATGFDDFFNVDADEGNQLEFIAHTTGNGVNGLEFSSAANSKVYGLALVTTPLFADRTQDLIFARAYYPADQQVLKQAAQQIAVSWKQPFG